MGFSSIIRTCAVALAFFTYAIAWQTSSSASEYPTRLIREEQPITVGGVDELWQLKWVAPPKPVCGANEFYMAITCPCMGFAYGEVGDLFLVRSRNGQQVDRLHLTPLFEQQFSNVGPGAIIQRCPLDFNKDSKANIDDVTKLAAKRPIKQVMKFGDYDHDGDASEFFLQTGTAPCGKRVGIMIGSSKENPRLHAFGTVSRPAKALEMQDQEWESLRKAHGQIEVTDWTCGDHGADIETTLKLHWTQKGIDGTRREFTCPPDHHRLISEKPL